jgi:hypothetical protein
MMQLAITIAIWILGLVFAAGGAWKLLQESQRHVNGLGIKFNRSEKEREYQYNQISLAIMALAQTPEQKAAVVLALRGGGDQP